MSASFCIRSMRLPFGRFFHVGGNKLTRSNHTVPGELTDSTNRAAAVVGAWRAVVSVTEYFRHAVSRFVTVDWAKVFAPSALSMDTTTEPPKPGAALAYNEA